MKSFKEYLLESKKTYDFKIKIAGDLPEKFDSLLKTILEKYGVSSVSKSSTPIQKVPLDFPTVAAQQVHIFEVNLNYPVTSAVLAQYVLEKTGVERSKIVVRSPNEPTEQYQAEEKNGKYVVKLGSEMESADTKAQDYVGEKHMMSFLKSLGTEKHDPTQYKGVNDELLAKSVPPADKQELMSNQETGSKSPLAGKMMSKPKGTR
jgi:hypothetical protein